MGQAWEVVEAKPVDSGRYLSSKRQPSSAEMDKGSSRDTTSTGSHYPPRISSRSNKPIADKYQTTVASTKVAASPPAVPSKQVVTTSPQPPPAPPKEKDSPARSRSSTKERDHVITGEVRKNSGQQPPSAFAPRSKSRSREATVAANVNKPQPPTPVPERRSSKNRPTSEVFDNPELGAQEAWEHGRMTSRGQSVILPDGFSVAQSSSARTSLNSSLVLNGGPTAGSAHTSFSIQPPFQAQQTRGRPGTPGYYYQGAPGTVPNPLPAPPTILPQKRLKNQI